MGDFAVGLPLWLDKWMDFVPSNYYIHSSLAKNESTNDKTNYKLGATRNCALWKYEINSKTFDFIRR